MELIFWWHHTKSLEEMQGFFVFGWFEGGFSPASIPSTKRHSFVDELATKYNPSIKGTLFVDEMISLKPNLEMC